MRLRTSGERFLAISFWMPRLSRYLTLHFALNVAKRLSTVVSLPNTISMGGNETGDSPPMTPM